MSCWSEMISERSEKPDRAPAAACLQAVTTTGTTMSTTQGDAPAFDDGRYFSIGFEIIRDGMMAILLDSVLFHLTPLPFAGEDDGPRCNAVGWELSQ